METGNPKQVAVLCVMAVGALGFLATRIGGKTAAATAAATARAETRKSGKAPSDAPLLIDPFSHAKLAMAKPISAPADSSTMPTHFNPLTGDIEGTLPLVPEVPEDESVPSDEKSKPKEERDPTPPAPAPVPTVEIALEATAGSSENVAFLSIDGADSKPYHPNDVLKSKVRLLSIEDGRVVVSGPKGQLTIEVGEHKRI